jgi:hypothetical protein
MYILHLQQKNNKINKKIKTQHECTIPTRLKTFISMQLKTTQFQSNLSRNNRPFKTSGRSGQIVFNTECAVEGQKQTEHRRQMTGDQ